VEVTGLGEVKRALISSWALAPPILSVPIMYWLATGALEYSCRWVASTLCGVPSYAPYHTMVCTPPTNPLNGINLILYALEIG
jgi:hypothetical protein